MSRRFSQSLKRTIDVVFAATALIILMPLIIVTALVLLIFEGWPIFYISRRHFSADKTFTVPKFRTMVRDALDPHHRLEERFMRDGYLDIPLECEVYTHLGRFLERTQIVEIPQFWCVLIGDMSLVGNRPLPSYNIKLLAKYPDWQRRFDSPAGITGITQVVGKLNFKPIERLQMESLYSEIYCSGNVVKADICICLITIWAVLLRKGISIETAQDLLLSCISLDNQQETKKRLNIPAREPLQ